MNGARGFLIKSMLAILTRPVEDVRRFDGQLCDPAAFLHSATGHLLLMSFEDFDEPVIEDAVTTVANAYVALRNMEPLEFQRSLLKPWQDGISIQ
jgi:hypothetical protein